MSLLLAFQSAPVAADILVSLEAEPFDDVYDDVSEILSIQPPDGDPFIGLESFELEEEPTEGFTGFFVEDDILAPILDAADFEDEDVVLAPDSPILLEFEELILFALEAFDDLEEFIVEDLASAVPDDPPPPEPIEFLYSLSDEFEFEPETGVENPPAALIR
jgi:hypothetical protein